MTMTFVAHYVLVAQMRSQLINHVEVSGDLIFKALSVLPAFWYHPDGVQWGWIVVSIASIRMGKVS